MKDQRAETWLTSFKIAFTYRDEVPLDVITVDRKAKENIRMTERLDADLVVRYGIALQNGADFPGVIVFPQTGAPGHYGLISGWHRIEAYRLCERSTIPAYVAAVSDPLLISTLRRSANVLEGKGPSMAEGLEHAIYLIRQGYSIADASRLMGVPTKRLNDRWLYEEVRGRLISSGIEIETMSLSASALARLSSVRDRHLGKIVTLSHEARLPAERIMELGRLVREASSDEAADRIVEQWEDLYREEIQRNRGGQVRAPGSAIRRLPVLLRQAERLMTQHGTADSVAALTKHDLTTLITSCRKTISDLQAMVTRLEEVKRHAD